MIKRHQSALFPSLKAKKQDCICSLLTSATQPCDLILPSRRNLARTRAAVIGRKLRQVEARCHLLLFRLLTSSSLGHKPFCSAGGTRLATLPTAGRKTADLCRTLWIRVLSAFSLGEYKAKM